MCIRDRAEVDRVVEAEHRQELEAQVRLVHERGVGLLIGACLLYTSDAADERSSVDLGGRRIIKKKTTDTTNHHRREQYDKECRYTTTTRIQRSKHQEESDT